MKLTDSYDGGNDPFEGDKTLFWASLPAGAKVSHAKLTLTPVSAPGGVLFQEEIDFTGNQGDWGATKATGNGGNPYVEIDFHKRRTLVSVSQTGLGASSAGGPDGASLQIDMGGVFVEINSKGAIETPTDPSPFSLQSDGTLPSLTVSKFRLIAKAAGNPKVSSVVIRTVPSNINVRLGKMGAFWPRPGDLVGADTSPDFADVLQVFLNNAPVSNGFYAVPLVIHSDTIARLQATLQVEYVQQASVMPDGVKEVVLPFDFGSVPNAQPGVLSVSLPANARVLAEATTARVLGAFDDTRVVYGPTGEVLPAGTVSVSPSDSQAALFSLDAATAAAAADVFITAQPPGVTLAVDLRADLDGKPDATSLIGSPAQATVPSRPGNQPVWISVPLGQEVHFQAKDQAKYWLVLQSLQGQADWSVQPASGGTAVMQHTQDGGLSWRETPAPAAASPPSGLFRLRQVPAAFQVPVDLQVGTGTQAQRVKLDRFQPLGRVDFSLNVPEVANGFNSYLTSAPAACSEAESLANGNFEQWAVVGNDPGKLTAIAAISGSVGAMAVSTDGKTAYVGMTDTNEQAVLAMIDVTCNRVVAQPIDLGSADQPQSVVLYPDGSKALVMGGGSLVLIDLLKSVLLKNVGIPIAAMIFNSNGSQLFVVTTAPGASGSTLFAIDTPTFEQNLMAGTLSTLLQSGGSSLPGQAVALAADQNRVYFLTDNPSAGQGTLLFVDPQTLLSNGDPLETGPEPLALAVAPDGSRAVVVNSDKEKTATIINIEHKGVTSLQLDKILPSSAAVVISPDSQRAFVAVQPDGGQGTVTILDLGKRSVVESIGANIDRLSLEGLSSLAIPIQGDQLYVGTSEGTPLSYLPLGIRVPADWFLTTGKVQLECAPVTPSSRITAKLGEGSVEDTLGQANKADAQDQSIASQPSALSQVAPISAGCRYDFSFEGLTNDPNAVAEVLWRGQNCLGVKTDSVPIPQVRVAFTNKIGGTPAFLTTLSGDFIAIAGSQPPQLVKASVRLTAPAGASSAEVRFTVPDGAASIATPSLIGTSQALGNTDLQTQPQQGTPDQWTLSPATARGFLTTANGSKVLLRNTGPDTADLVQTAPVTANQNFNLNFTGRTVTANAGDSPRVELNWRKTDGSEAGTAVSEDISPETFDSHPIAGQVPAGAATVEVHLSLPSGTALAVDEVSLTMPKTTSVPVSFVAQSPGQLRISGAQVGYDTAPPSPLPVPAGGLCPPTPPGQKPGQQPPGSCYCSCCQAASQMTQPAPAVTPAGRPMTVGQCPDCGNQVVSGGGPLVVGAAQPLTIRVVPAHGLQPTSGEAVAIRPTPAPALTEVMGIGKTRAQQLKRGGIKTVRDLADADPAYVATVVRGVSVENAALLVEHAKKLLATIT